MEQRANTYAETTSPMSSVPTQPAPSNAEAKTGGNTPEDSEAEDAPRQPAPAPSITNIKYFGDDPSTFPDATDYAIPELTDDMTTEEKAELLRVASFPKSDLADRMAGVAP